MALKTIYSAIPRITLSPEGTFKYILIHVTLPGGELAEFIRGEQSLEYHKDNFQKFRKEFASKHPIYQGKPLVEEQDGVSISCPGGGRVTHSGNLE